MFLAMVSFFVLGLVVPVLATPYVFFDPPITTVDLDETFELSFRVAACPDSIASTQLYMSWDPGIVELVEATEGSLYAESGHMTWFIDDLEYPGFLHLFDTVFGVGTHILAPGELFHLTFHAVAEGHTQAHVDTIRMTDVRRNALAIGGFEHGEIFVGQTGVEEPVATDLQVGPAWPNPFTAETAIAFSVPAASGEWSAGVYDIKGRLVRRLTVPVGATRGEIAWDGRDAEGREVPASVYFVRISGPAGDAHARLVRLR